MDKKFKVFLLFSLIAIIGLIGCGSNNHVTTFMQGTFKYEIEDDAKPTIKNIFEMSRQIRKLKEGKYRELTSLEEQFAHINMDNDPNDSIITESEAKIYEQKLKVILTKLVKEEARKFEGV